MVRGDDGDDQLMCLEGLKRAFDILYVATKRLDRDFGYEENGETSTEGHANVKNNKRVRTRTTMSSISGKRQKKIDECENQDPKQNPNRDASSPSLCRVEFKRPRQVVSKKVVRSGKAPVGRRKPVREREVVQERGRTPEWLVNVMRQNNGTDVKMIKEKVLKWSDIDKGKARLLIPWKGIVDKDFLNERELKTIDDHFKKITKTGLDFTLVDPRGEKWKLNLKRWDMRSSSYYALALKWNSVVASNKLEIDQRLQIWSFHSLDELYIALVPPDPAPVRDSERLDILAEVCRTHLEALQEANISDQTILEAQEEWERRVFVDVPRRRLTPRVPVPAPAPYRDLEGLDILAEAAGRICLEALQEANRRSSLVSVTELDLPAPVVSRDAGQNSSTM